MTSLKYKIGDLEINHAPFYLFIPEAIYQFNYMSIKDITFYYSFGKNYIANEYCVARWIIKPKQNATNIQHSS